MIRLGEELQAGDAMVVVDVQKDFFPGGALPVAEAEAVLPVLNRAMALAEVRGVPVYATRDWHHPVHVSFAEHGGPWPPHCLQDTEGARFHPGLALPEAAIVVTKGVRFDHDQNSAFDETGLEAELRRRGVMRLWVGGLAEDVCVLATVLDGIEAGFEAVVLADGVRPVTRRGGVTARRRMRLAGARFALVEELPDLPELRELRDEASYGPLA